MTQTRSMVGPLVGALLLSLGSTYVLGKHLSGAKVTRPVMRQYLSPRRAIEPGEVLQASEIQRLNWPAEQPIDGGLDRLEQAVGRAAIYPLSPGQPLVERDLAPPGSGSGLASKVPNGMRAIALRSDEVMGVAGFLQPESHVDVLATYRLTQMAEPSTATVLQNAEVIAAGQQTKPDPEGKAVSTTVVTLLLTPQQAERALLASNQGVLHFVLRNSTDQAIQLTEPVTLSELTGLSKTARLTEIASARPSSVRVPHRPDRAESQGVEIVLGSAADAPAASKTSHGQVVAAPGELESTPAETVQTVAAIPEPAPEPLGSHLSSGRQP